MKFWQLTSIMRKNLGIVRRISRGKPEWKFVADWIDDHKNILASQDRTKLDKVLPVELVRAVLAKCKLKFYLAKDRVLRSKRHSFFDKSLSALQTFDQFGGDAMEEVLEHGSVAV
jgi:hypothetical protein